MPFSYLENLLTYKSHFVENRKVLFDLHAKVLVVTDQYESRLN
jgi:hypothetical protein